MITKSFLPFSTIVVAICYLLLKHTIVLIFPCKLHHTLNEQFGTLEFTFKLYSTELDDKFIALGRLFRTEGMVVAIYMMTHGAAQQSGRQMGTTAAPDLPSLSPPRSLSFRELAADCGLAFPS